MSSDYINQREDLERRQAVDAQSGSWLVPFAAGIGAIALGAHLLKTRLTNGGNITKNLFNFLGVPQGITLSDVAANTGKSSIKSNTSGLRSVLNASFDFNRNRVNIGPIDLIDDLRNSIDLQGAARDKTIADHIKERTVEYINREFSGFGNNTGYFTQGLQRVTAGQILEDQANWGKVIGVNQVSVVQSAVNRGLIGTGQVLDKRLYYNPNTTEVLDLRFRNLLTKVKEFNTTQGPIHQRVARFDIFGQADVLASLVGSKRNIAVLGPGDGFNGSRVFIGGDIFGYSRQTAGAPYSPTLIAQNRMLRPSGGVLDWIDASRMGTLNINLPTRSGMMTPMGWMEENLGIGTAFATRRSFIQRWILDPYNRYQALRKGQATVFQHPFRREFGASKVMDAALGGEYPELAMSGGNIVPVDGGNIGRDLRFIRGTTLGIIPKRVAALFDLLDNNSVIKRSSYNAYIQGKRQSLASIDQTIPRRNRFMSIDGRRIASMSNINDITDISRGDLTAVGFPSRTNTYSFYDIQMASFRGKSSKFMTSLRDLPVYMVNRVSNLFSESLLGIAFKPDHRILPTLGRMAAIPFVYQAGLRAAEYADYLTERITGVSPFKVAGSVYAGARVAQQYLRDVTGVRAGLEFLDKYFPGSINSDGSTVARSILAPMYAASYLLGKGKFTGAIAGAAATYAAIGGPTPEQTPNDLIREYAGDKKVPVRKGAFWSMGYLPFFGGRVERYDYSWYAKLQSDYRNKSLYGSNSEYWSHHANVFGVPFPTPSNLFGVLNVIDPYRLESQHYYDRPYPQTEHPISKFPIFGPILGATIGNVLKPAKYREPTELPLLAAGLADRGLTANTARLVGIAGMNATAYEAEDPATLLNTIKKQANIASEPLGVYKFAMEFFGVKFGTDLGTEYATSAMMQDPGRSLYDSGIGGALGQTEMIRRFLINDYSAPYRRAAAINPIANSLPRWLPGIYAESKRDQSYFIDFTSGDAYAKIADGESRLPGAGYESLNQLHSGVAGEYSDVDRFLILADVAPYSAAYKKYEKRVMGMQLDEAWTQRVQEAIEQRKEVIGVDTRYKRYAEDLIAINQGIISKSLYAPVRKAYDFLTHDILAEIPYLGSKFFPFRNPYEQYRKLHVEGSEFASWDRPWEDIVRPMAYDIGLEDPITAAGKGAGMGFLLSGPFRWFTPFKSIVGAAGAHMINKTAIAQGAIVGAGLSTARILGGYGEDMIPFHMRDQEDAVRYMDTLNYIRGELFSDMGIGGRQPSTMLGAKNPIQYRSALPTSADRRFFDYFVSQEDQGVRSQIFEGLPSYMKEGLASSWGGDYYSDKESEAIAVQFINNNQIPDSSWLGWNPQVSNSAVRLRLVDHGINGVSDNYHKFGFFESHEVDLKTRLREFADQEINFVQTPIHTSFDQFIKGQASQITKGSYSIQSMGTPLGRRKNLTIKEDRGRESFEALRQTLK